VAVRLTNDSDHTGNLRAFSLKSIPWLVAGAD